MSEERNQRARARVQQQQQHSHVLAAAADTSLGQRLFFPPLTMGYRSPAVGRYSNVTGGRGGGAGGTGGRQGSSSGNGAPVVNMTMTRDVSEHVELSRRIQREQMSAMLGLVLDYDTERQDDRDIGLDIDD